VAQIDRTVKRGTEQCADVLAVCVCVSSKVVAGMVDPFPLVGGKGLQRLQDNGVQVGLAALASPRYKTITTSSPES
jgi:pyrimidine deaminase RibD-like protein